jgi:hypothetical protein
MASAPTDSDGTSAVPRRRGKSKAPNHSYSGPVSVIPLELDVSNDRVRQGLERQWEAVFRLRRALKRDAQGRCRAYWAAHHERAADPKALRERLGLTRKAMEAAAKKHIEASAWMRHHLTKAIGLHVADEVWETIDRHLFADTSGRRHGPPRIGSWWGFTRIPGRARSHTKARPVWETWRLVGTLDGLLQTYRDPELPEMVTTGLAAVTQPAGTSILAQPTRLPTPSKPAGSWWEHDGQLAVVHWSSRRGCGVAGAAAAGRGSVGAPRPLPGRSQPLAQDRPRAGAGPSRARWVAVLRTSADPPLRL